MNRKKTVVLACAALLVDQVLKWLFSTADFPLIPGVLALHGVKNTGFALGLFPAQHTAALLTSAVMLLAILLIFIFEKPKGLGAWAMGLLMGGAVGNLIDRVFFSCVRDIFELLFMNFYIFNFADVCVVAGAVMAAISVLFRPADWSKA